MIPAAGGSQTLPRNSSPAAALDLLLTGRRIGAEEALALGLITRLTPRSELEPAAWKLALNLANPPSAADGQPTSRYIKQAIHGGLDLALAEGLQLEKRLACIALNG